MDRSPAEFCYGFYNGVATKHPDVVQSILASMKEGDDTLKKLEGENLVNDPGCVSLTYV